jgi:Cu(I)/Ag(I) efflux system membrane protein CusA/SilA
MRYGENPLEVTERIKAKIAQLQAGLPEGVRIVPFYDRTSLIERAIHTVTGTLREEMIVASLAILLVLWHFRSAVVVCITLPLAVLIAFIMMRVFNIPSNIMSLSGIAISIGVLVDSSIVMVENATHHLYERFGNRKITGDTRELVLPAMRTVGRPIFFAVIIMVISFLPIFALSGMEGRMFHPLAWTKTFAMVGVSILAITLVPALIPLLIRGRLHSEDESWIVRSVIEIYKPVLTYLLDHPWPIVLLTGMIFIFGAVPTGVWWVLSLALAVALLGCVWANHVEPRSAGSSLRLVALLGSVVLIALLADSRMSRVGSEFMPPLNEGTILDMPVTIPRASITEVADDLKARDALLRSFPEVSLVVGKAGRAETPTDPAPPDMVETVVNLRPREHWPKRELRFDDARRQTEDIYKSLIARGWMTDAADKKSDLIGDATMFALEAFDKRTRDMANQDYAQFEISLAPQLASFAVKESVRRLNAQGKLLRQPTDEDLAAVSEALPKEAGAHLVESPDIATVTNLAQQLAAELAKRGLVKPSPDLLLLTPGPTEDALRNAGEVIGIERPTFFSSLLAAIERQRDDLWTEHVKQFNWHLFDESVPFFTETATDQLRSKAKQLGLWNNQTVDAGNWNAAIAELSAPFAKQLFLWQKDKAGLQKEMDTVCQVPGWGNIWTQPIVNRVDMLATGVRTMIGVKIYGDDLNKIQTVSDQIASVLRAVRGAADVFPDQSIGEAYLEINIDRDRAARFGVNVGDIQDVVETALGGKMITMTVEGRERFPVRVRYGRAFREDEESVKNLLVSTAAKMEAPSSMAGAGSGQSAAKQSLDTMSSAASAAAAGDVNLDPFSGGMTQIPLSQIADVHIVQGPSMIKSENGLLRSYVQLNVRDRDIVGFVDEAQRVVAEKVKLPPGMYLEWSGQFEHQVRSKRTIMVIFPIVVLTIFALLYLTYNDLWDALLMMLAVPGALAGGVLFQVLFGFNFSVAVWVGFIACFGMATQTGVVMLVYLREAVERYGGLAEIPSLASLKRIILEGAVHRLRPKLLTEGTIIIGLAPMLWATGTGAEIMRPMAAPVLGGILVADEVIDLLIPVLFYHVRAARWRKLHAQQARTQIEDPEAEPALTTV